MTQIDVILADVFSVTFFATASLLGIKKTHLLIQIMPGKGDVLFKLAVSRIQNVMQSNTSNQSSLFTQ